MSTITITVHLVIDNKVVQVPYTNQMIAEDVCLLLCKQLSIGPVARHLFGLRVTGKQIYLAPASTLNIKHSFDFRIRYKMVHIAKLKEADINAYDYYFYQVRSDVLENKIPDLIYEKYKRELVGLGVTDMYRVMLEKDLPKESVESEYRKYIPKEALRRHYIFIKKPIHDSLGKIEKAGHDSWYVKMEYLKQLEVMAPEYLAEEYKAITDQDGAVCTIYVKVSPFHETQPGIRISFESKREQWQHICAIEELCYISVRKDGTVEISRKNGIPFYLKFHSVSYMLSFVSVLDGYYRLTCKWIFNLCKDVYTPSLQKLYAMKCHGPVGGEFSYAKLEEKRNNRAGCFILRESESKYNVYYIDVCMKDRKPKTFKLERLSNDEYIFNDDLKRYKSIHQLIAAYSDPKEYIFLQECLPPSEYDKSPLLLCLSQDISGDSLTDSSALHSLLSFTPLCINCKDLQVYKGLEYKGHQTKTESGVRCQLWQTNNPIHKVEQNFGDDKFPDFSKILSKNYCRNPNKDPKGPWCYTMDPNLIDETCALPICTYTDCKVTGPGIEYAGIHNKGVSERNCLKWNKNRQKVKYKGDTIKLDKFSNSRFPDESIGSAKKQCRNPDGNIGGPWCFVEDEDTMEIRREFCDIPFCDVYESLIFSQDYPIYSHYFSFDHTITNFTFGLKLWDSDSYNVANARLVLSLYSLPLHQKHIHQSEFAIEISISNNNSSLSAGYKSDLEYEPSIGVLKSTDFTFFSISWSSGFITLHKEGDLKPIFLNEFKIKNNLLGFLKDRFYFYSFQGANILWTFPFINSDSCTVHTTTSLEYQDFFPLRETNVGRDLVCYVRAVHSANILLVTSPPINYPCIEISLLKLDNMTRIVAVEYEDGPRTVLKEAELFSILNYWNWNQFSFTIFSDTLSVYWRQDASNHLLAEVKHSLIKLMRWFSPSSTNNLAHWTFYCEPPKFANPPNALPPECVLNQQEPNYKGRQAITKEGLPCLPWASSKLIREKVHSWFPNKTIFEAQNYCRNPNNDPEGIFCYAIHQNPNISVTKSTCRVRVCKSAECKMAGTGNDYVGKLNTTRSNRTCVNWLKFLTNNTMYAQYLNDTLYPDMSIEDAGNFCRNPSRSIGGSWCFTSDTYVIKDICNVRDCNKPEECTIIVRDYSEGQKKEGPEGITIVYRSMWRLTKGKKMEVAMKILKHDCYEKYLKEFMELAGHWAFLQSNSIVRLYGVTLRTPVSMVLEQVRLGPLDTFLRNNRSIIKTVDLIEAASNLASALWHLEENKIVHGNIRCRKLLVSRHEENAFTVKLGDPGIVHSYASKEVHWIPVECYSNLEYAKHSTAADVWAFATTTWEIFMFGETIKESDHIDAMRFYASGKRLPQPSECPNNIYQLMQECWDADPHRRKQPQALMRDISQILYQVYNSRRIHSYSKVSTKSHLESQMDAASVNSLFSTATQSTVVGGFSDELISICDADSDCDLSTSSRDVSYERKWLFSEQDRANYEDDMSCDFSTILSNFNFSVATSATSLDSISSMQSIFELDADCNVILQGRIGQGFYGEVYKGTLEYLGDKDSEPRQVAVKKLKTSAVSTCIQDFEREISIMKTLKHPNIVEILGVLQEPEVSLVMEFVQHGSLQSYLKIYRESLSTKQLLKYSLDIAEGMDYLGTKHIVHRDLAARNILVVDENHVKISDFGLAQVMEANEYYILKTNRELPIKWYAPESLRDGKFSPRSDVWSYGVTMCEMFAYGEEPKLHITLTEDSVGQEQQILLNAIENGTRFPCPPMCPQSVYVRIIYPCWQANPHERPTFHQLREETEDLLTQN